MSRGKKILELAITEAGINKAFLPIVDQTNNSSALESYKTNNDTDLVPYINKSEDQNVMENLQENTICVFPVTKLNVVENVVIEEVFSDFSVYELTKPASLYTANDQDKTNVATTSSSQNILESDDLISDDDDEIMTTLVPYSDHSDSDISSEKYPIKSKIRKKRFQVDKKTWFSEQNYKLRETGNGYVGRRKQKNEWVYDVKKQARTMKSRCSCKQHPNSNLKCISVSDPERQIIFDHFWGLTWGEKKILIDTTVSVIPICRPRNRQNQDASRRSQSILYHLRVKNINVRVCRTMFVNTLSIGRMSVLEWKKKSGQGVERTHNIEQTTRVKPFQKENNELICFLDSLPAMESHYCRSSTQKKYLLPEWQSKQSLYKFYVDEWCKLKNITPLSITTFNQVFSSKNIALFQPKKDQCEKCSAYKVGHISEEEYNLHISKKEEARIEKDKDKANESLVFTMDLQAVLMAPKSKISSLYYKTKLCVHNFCLYNLNNKDGFCYIWNETEGGVNAEEFATICADFITKKVLPTIDRNSDEKDIKIILYSDGCTYQNRNVTMSNALLNIAMLEKITIEQKYLEVGHTQMEADSMHSTIERHLRNKIINVPAEYYTICRGARKNPERYDVTYLNHTFFKNFNNVGFLKSIRPGKKKGDSKVS